MSNFKLFKGMLEKYLEKNDIQVEIQSNLHEVSINKSGKKDAYYVYNGENDLEVIDMDVIAKKAYKVINKAEGINNVVNTADAFLINRENEWYFIEFKDSTINASNDKLKNNVLKKAYSNYYMLLDILYDMKEDADKYIEFSLDDPIKFAKEHIHYIVVCSTEKNYNVFNQVKNCDLCGEKYTPEFMQRLKDYLFKDAYIYTEDYLERKFVERFAY